MFSSVTQSATWKIQPPLPSWICPLLIFKYSQDDWFNDRRAIYHTAKFFRMMQILLFAPLSLISCIPMAIMCCFTAKVNFHNTSLLFFLTSTWTSLQSMCSLWKFFKANLMTIYRYTAILIVESTFFGCMSLQLLIGLILQYPSPNEVRTMRLQNSWLCLNAWRKVHLDWLSTHFGQECVSLIPRTLCTLIPSLARLQSISHHLQKQFLGAS